MRVSIRFFLFLLLLLPTAGLQAGRAAQKVQESTAWYLHDLPFAEIRREIPGWRTLWEPSQSLETLPRGALVTAGVAFQVSWMGPEDGVNGCYDLRLILLRRNGSMVPMAGSERTLCEAGEIELAGALSIAAQDSYRVAVQVGHTPGGLIVSPPGSLWVQVAR